jgi:hypothetical protein
MAMEVAGIKVSQSNEMSVTSAKEKPERSPEQQLETLVRPDLP